MDDIIVSHNLYKEDYMPSLSDSIKNYINKITSVSKIKSIYKDYYNNSIDAFIDSSLKIISTNILYYYLTNQTKSLKFVLVYDNDDVMNEAITKECNPHIIIEIPYLINWNKRNKYSDSNLSYLTKLFDKLVDELEVSSYGMVCNEVTYITNQKEIDESNKTNNSTNTSTDISSDVSTNEQVPVEKVEVTPIYNTVAYLLVRVNI